MWLPGPPPRETSVAELERLPSTTRLPVVLYAHGCGGLDSDFYAWAPVLAGDGYAVVAPDSFARAWRRATCSPAAFPVRSEFEVLALRDREIAYAQRQLRTLSGVRPEAIFLFGYSQGGIATARSSTDPPFRAYVITAWGCTAPDVRNGLLIPASRPVLAIRWSSDAWLAHQSVNGDCGIAIGERPGSRSIVLEGTGHSTATDASARRAVLDFLRRYR